MIEKLFNQPHLLHQQAAEDENSEASIAASIDNSGIISLSQEGRHICVNTESVDEFCQLLNMLKKLKTEGYE